MFNHIYQSKPEFLWVKQSVLNRQKMQKEKIIKTRSNADTTTNPNTEDSDRFFG